MPIDNAQKRILVVDDHELIRHGVQMVLQRRPHWQICGSARSGREAVTKVSELKPDAVIMDLTMPDLNGLEATRQIKEKHPDTEVLILTGDSAEETMRSVVDAGARGYLLKSEVGQTLIEALEAVLQHKIYVSPKITRKRPLDEIPSETTNGFSIATLTTREREVVQLVAEGKSTKEVADVLGISLKTADTHRTNIMRKLGLHSVTDLVRYAVRNRIIEP